MAQSLTKVYVHITFSTKNRYPFIDNKIEQELWSYLGGICKMVECNPICVGGQYEEFYWQDGYGIFSLFRRALPYAIDYRAFSPPRAILEKK